MSISVPDSVFCDFGADRHNPDGTPAASVPVTSPLVSLEVLLEESPRHTLPWDSARA
jgi:hypothetical protein